MSEVILVSVTGQDRPGLTAELTGILASYDVTVLDIGQSVIHNSLSLGMLIESPMDDGCSVFKELLFKCHELNLNIRFTPIAEKDYEHWVQAQGRARHIVTLLGRQITARYLSRVPEVVGQHGFNIDHISRLSRRISLQESTAHQMSHPYISTFQHQFPYATLCPSPTSYDVGSILDMPSVSSNTR